MKPLSAAKDNWDELESRCYTTWSFFWVFLRELYIGSCDKMVGRSWSHGGTEVTRCRKGWVIENDGLQRDFLRIPPAAGAFHDRTRRPFTGFASAVVLDDIYRTHSAKDMANNGVNFALLF